MASHPTPSTKKVVPSICPRCGTEHNIRVRGYMERGRVRAYCKRCKRIAFYVDQSMIKGELYANTRRGKKGAE